MKPYLFLSLLSLLNFSCRPEALEHQFPEINEVQVGSKFRINLPEDHQTGYVWQLNSDYDASIIKQLNTVWHGKQKGIDFNFKALAQGQTAFKFIKRKYTDTSDIKTFLIKVSSK